MGKHPKAKQESSESHVSAGPAQPLSCRCGHIPAPLPQLTLIPLTQDKRCCKLKLNLNLNRTDTALLCTSKFTRANHNKIISNQQKAPCRTGAFVPQTGFTCLSVVLPVCQCHLGSRQSLTPHLHLSSTSCPSAAASPQLWGSAPRRALGPPHPLCSMVNSQLGNRDSTENPPGFSSQEHP